MFPTRSRFGLMPPASQRLQAGGDLIRGNAVRWPLGAEPSFDGRLGKRGADEVSEVESGEAHSLSQTPLAPTTSVWGMLTSQVGRLRKKWRGPNRRGTKREIEGWTFVWSTRPPHPSSPSHATGPDDVYEGGITHWRNTRSKNVSAPHPADALQPWGTLGSPRFKRHQMGVLGTVLPPSHALPETWHD